MDNARLLNGVQCEAGAELQARIESLANHVAEIRSLEERCQRAETALKAMEKRSRLWRECAPMGVCALDVEGKVATINQKMRAMLSSSPTTDGDGRRSDQPLELLESCIGRMARQCLQDKETLIFERSRLSSQEAPEWVRYHVSSVCDECGIPVGTIAFGEDTTALHEAEQALRESEERYRLLFQSAPVAMIERDGSTLKAHIEELRSSGVSDFRDYAASHSREILRCMSMIRTVSYNAAFLELMEISDDTALSDGLAMALFEDADDLAREIFLMLADGATTNEKERTFTTRMGKKKSVLAKTLVLSGHEDTFARIVIALIDISHRKEAEQALRISERRFHDQAMRDDLTGLFNRRYLYRSLEKLLRAGTANGSRISIVFMDIDHFKEVVDTYGHLSGSEVIRELGTTIGRSLESPAYAVAYAGDEFVIVLPGFDQERATRKAHEIRILIEGSTYLRDQGAEVRLSASFGIASFPDHAQDMTRLLAAADQALFTVKQAAKGSIGLYGSQSILR